MEFLRLFVMEIECNDSQAESNSIKYEDNSVIDGQVRSAERRHGFCCQLLKHLEWGQGRGVDRLKQY